MQKRDLNILIVDDDQAIGKALREAFVRAGFKSMHVTKPDEAIALVKLHPVHAAIVDCMLPKMNGKDLAKKLKEETHESLPIFLISGIYKDKNFAREALQQTGSTAFFTKPFEIPEILVDVTEALEPLIDVELSPLHRAMCVETLSPIERINAVNEQENIQGFELPWVYSLLMFTKVSGLLNLVSSDGDSSTVGFRDGKIVQVNLKDARSYFGVLMVEYGFISQEELDETLKKTGKAKRMGERLVEANVLSPHAINIVMAEQQGIRLGKTLRNSPMKVHFTEQDDVAEDAVLERGDLLELVNEWMMSKITVEWLRAFYRPWMRYNVKKGSEYHPRHKILHKSVLERTPSFHENLLKYATVEEAFQNTPAAEEHLYASLNVVIVSGILRFGEPVSSFDYAAQKNRLIKLAQDLSKQNFFERLGVSPKSKESDIKKAYHELAKVLHPDKLSIETPAEVQELARTAFGLISEAYETLANHNARAQYLLEQEKGKAEAILESELLKEDARRGLSKGDFRKSLELLERALTLAPPVSETKLFHMWAKIKSAPAGRPSPALLTQARDLLSSIPPEDRHNPTYYFVKALSLQLQSDISGAKKSLEHAVMMDPQFIDAKRELTMLTANESKSQNVDLLHADLKDVFGMIMKRVSK
jgi:curved DNA-binding protein CbpA/response regulator RpfG family c-di-GMP phosphodiesterase